MVEHPPSGHGRIFVLEDVADEGSIPSRSTMANSNIPSFLPLANSVTLTANSATTNKTYVHRRGNMRTPGAQHMVEVSPSQAKLVRIGNVVLDRSQIKLAQPEGTSLLVVTFRDGSEYELATKNRKHQHEILNGLVRGDTAICVD